MLKCEGTCNVMSALKHVLQLQTQLHYEQSGCHDKSLGESLHADSDHVISIRCVPYHG